MWATCSSGGCVPCQRQTTIGTAHNSHSAIQQTSSSWNHGVILAARQSRQSGSRVNGAEGSPAGTLLPYLKRRLRAANGVPGPVGARFATPWPYGETWDHQPFEDQHASENNEAACQREEARRPAVGAARHGDIQCHGFAARDLQTIVEGDRARPEAVGAA